MREDDAAKPAPEPEEASVGRTLREARESRHLSLLQVSEALRIEPQFLSALEQDRFDALGAPVFVKGYLKNYAECLGLDSRKLLEAYRNQRGDEEPIVQARRSIGEEQERPVGAWVVAGLAAALIAGFLWTRGPEDDAERFAATGPVSDSPPVEQPVEAVRPGSEPLPRSLDEPIPPRAVDPAPLPSPDSVDGPSAGTAAPTEDPSAEAADPARPGSAPGREGDRSPTPESDRSAGAAEAGAAARALGELDIELRFMEDSWAEVTGPGNQRFYYGLGRAGGEARISAPPPVNVLLGNADGVAVEVDGEPFRYPASSRSGNLANFTLSAATE
jgi:cytoskeleton protein RodZ